MSNLAHLLQEVHYRKLTDLSGKYDMKKSGKKVDVIKRLVDKVPEKKLRVYLMEFLGIGEKMLEHELVPKHRILKEDEIEKLKEEFSIKKWQLPKMLDKDPVAMLLGAQPGDVLHIRRKSETAGEVDYYRLVVRGT